VEKRWVATINLESLQVESDPSFRFKCLQCASCCMNLEIPLRDEDITRIEDIGFNAWEFVDYEKMFYRGDKFLGYGIRKRPFDDACVFWKKMESVRYTPTDHWHVSSTPSS